MKMVINRGFVPNIATAQKAAIFSYPINGNECHNITAMLAAYNVRRYVTRAIMQAPPKQYASQNLHVPRTPQSREEMDALVNDICPLLNGQSQALSELCVCVINLDCVAAVEPADFDLHVSENFMQQYREDVLSLIEGNQAMRDILSIAQDRGIKEHRLYNIQDCTCVHMSSGSTVQVLMLAREFTDIWVAAIQAAYSQMNQGNHGILQATPQIDPRAIRGFN
jgi:hypothetical protein